MVKHPVDVLPVRFDAPCAAAPRGFPGDSGAPVGVYDKITFMNKRVGYFDIAKGIGIILVIIAHIEYMPLGLREYIVTFHMPAFFVISGMLMNLTGERERPCRTLITRKLKSIMLPYLIFSVIFPLMDIVRYTMEGRDDVAKIFGQDLVAGITMTGVSVLWFLPSLFFSELIVLFIVKNLKRPLLLVMSILLPVALWFLALVIRPMALPLWRTVYCSILVLMGFILFPVIRKASSYPVSVLPVSILLFVILYFTGKANGIVDLHFILLGNKPLYYVNALMGSMGLILLSVFIEDKAAGHFAGLLEFYGRHSLFIMITHIDFMIMYLSERLSFAISDATPRGKEPVFNISATVITLMIETVLILLWKNIQWMFFRCALTRHARQHRGA